MLANVPRLRISYIRLCCRGVWRRARLCSRCVRLPRATNLHRTPTPHPTPDPRTAPLTLTLALTHTLTLALTLTLTHHPSP